MDIVRSAINGGYLRGMFSSMYLFKQGTKRFFESFLSGFSLDRFFVVSFIFCPQKRDEQLKRGRH